MRIAQVVAVVVTALALVSGTAVTEADVPQTMNYQGVLRNTAGTPMPGSHSMAFRLYRDSTGGTPLWEELRSVTVDSAGLFNVLLGAVTPIPDSVFAAGAYLGTTVAPDAEMAHRVPLSSVGYAFRVNSVDGAAGGKINGGVILDGSVGVRTSVPSATLDVVNPDFTNDVLRIKGLTNAEVRLSVEDENGGRGVISKSDWPVAGFSLQNKESGSRLNLGTSNGDIDFRVAASPFDLSDPSLVKLHIDGSSGNVGIGTTSPDQKLGVNGIIGAYPTPWVPPTTRGIFMHHTGTAGYIWAYNYPAGEGDPVSVDGKDISLRTYSGGGTFVRLSVQNDGNVGIGTATPIYKLHTEGSSYSIEHFTGGVNVGNGSSFSLNRGDEFRFQTSYGYAPGPVKIAVRGNFANDALDAQDALSLGFSRQEGVDYDYGYPYMFDINQFGSTKFRLDKFGNVGIGTTSPAAKLDVAGTVNATTYYGDGSHLTGISGTTDNDWTINGNDIYHLNGNVGIGTSAPSRNLMVAGDADFNGSDPAELVRVENHDAATNADGIFARTHSLDGGAGLSGDAIEVTDGNTYGVLGVTKARSITSGSGAGVYGWAAYTGTCGDVFGVLGVTEGKGGTGVGSTTTAGVYGLATADTGTNFGVFGEVKSKNANMAGVYGIGNNTAGRVHGVLGLTASPITGSAGVFGASAPSGVTYGVFGRQDSPSGYAGKFQGNVDITGTLTKGGGAFRIDHPLDPENKYLSHSFVESPDMMNIYNGNVMTDANGDATVVLPDYFEALNRDFRYQLTVIGKQFAQARVEEEITNNQFKIKTDRPSVRVSWQVTGIRHDAFATAHRIVPEQEKPAGEHGTYLYPKEHGVPEPQIESVDYSAPQR